MSLPEQGAKVATSAIDALKSNPVILALVLLQIVVLALLGWYSHERTKSNDRLIELYHKQFEVLVQRCSDGRQGRREDGDYKLQSEESKPYILPELQKDLPGLQEKLEEK